MRLLVASFSDFFLNNEYMLYSVHIFVGREFDNVLPSIASSMYRFDQDALNYNSLYRVDVNGRGILSFTNLKVELDSDVTRKMCGSEVSFNWSAEASVKATQLPEYYSGTIFAEMLHAGVVADSLHVYLHFPLYKEKSIATMQSICEAIKSTALPSEIDFIGYCDDMSRFIEPSYKIETSAEKVIPAFVKMREQVGLNLTGCHLVAIENKTVEGFPLIVHPSNNCTPEEKALIEKKATVSFAEMIAQLLYLLSEYYENIFPRTVEQQDVTGLGFSTLYFDKYIFANYLLQRAALQAMDRESVNQSEVDINKPISAVNDLLKNRETIYSQFINRYKGKEDVAQYDELKTDIKSILDDLNKRFAGLKNMPDKAAVLAVLLSKSECELFSSSIFDVNNRCYNDLYNEVINYFIEEDKAKFYLRNDEECIVNPLNELKEINRKTVNSESHIRELEKSLAELQKQIELNAKVQDCYVDDNGYYNFGQKKFRLLPNIDEEPLGETYEGHDVAAQSADLSGKFTSIKNQGQQGSCLSFTLTSIFEYMLRMSNAVDTDLSEAFLYYNAREMDSTGDVDSTVDRGSRFHPAIGSLSKFGIALERFCPYDEGVYDRRPSDEAYADAEKRKLIKALNVNITVNDFKSALVDGYPIAASFILCESFFQNQTQSTGYVSMPTSEEIDKALGQDGEGEQHKHTCHAMAIVGFSDQLQMFLVRNSWGDDWGDNGYCYVPYSYVEQEGLVNFACIITEVASIENVSPELRQIPAMKIDNADLHIRYYIDLAALHIEQKCIMEYKQRRIDLLEYFELLKARYANANERDLFIDKNVELLNAEKTDLQEECKKAEIKKEEIAIVYKSEIKKKLIYFAIFVVASLFTFWGINTILKEYVYEFIDSAEIVIEDSKQALSDEINAAFISGGDSIADDVVAKPAPTKKVAKAPKEKDYFYLNYLWLLPAYLIYFIVIAIQSHKLWKQWREERDELDIIIDRHEQRIAYITTYVSQFRHKTFAAWQTIKSLSEVQLKVETLYSNYLSLLNNLRAWYEQIRTANDEVRVESSFPNISILDKDLMDKYFDSELSSSSICDVSFADNIEQHEVSGEYLSKYQTDLLNLIYQRLVAFLQDIDFDISAHVAKNKFANLALPVTHELFSRFDRQSNIFMQINSTRRGVIAPRVEVFTTGVDVYANDLYVKMRPIEANYIESNDRYRMMIVKTSTYYFDECVALRPAKTK